MARKKALHKQGGLCKIRRSIVNHRPELASQTLKALVTRWASSRCSDYCQWVWFSMDTSYWDRFWCKFVFCSSQKYRFVDVWVSRGWVEKGSSVWVVAAVTSKFGEIRSWVFVKAKNNHYVGSRQGTGTRNQAGFQKAKFVDRKQKATWIEMYDNSLELILTRVLFFSATLYLVIRTVTFKAVF